MVGGESTEIHFRRLLQQLKMDQAWMQQHSYLQSVRFCTYWIRTPLANPQVQKAEGLSVGCKWYKHNTVRVQKQGQQGINSPAVENVTVHSLFKHASAQSSISFW